MILISRMTYTEHVLLLLDPKGKHVVEQNRQFFFLVKKYFAWPLHRGMGSQRGYRALRLIVSAELAIQRATQCVGMATRPGRTPRYCLLPGMYAQTRNEQQKSLMPFCVGYVHRMIACYTWQCIYVVIEATGEKRVTE